MIISSSVYTFQYIKKIKIYFYGNVFKTKHHQKKQKTKYNIEN